MIRECVVMSLDNIRGNKVRSFLTLLGITLPWSPTVSFFLFYGAFLVMQFALFYFFLLRVNAAYALTYEVIRPKPAEPQQGGVVLGNIFDLAREQEM